MSTPHRPTSDLLKSLQWLEDGLIDGYITDGEILEWVKYQISLEEKRLISVWKFNHSTTQIIN